MSKLYKDYIFWGRGEIKMYSTLDYLNCVKRSYNIDDLNLINKQLEDMVKQKRDLKMFKEYKESREPIQTVKTEQNARIPNSFFEYARG